MDTLRISNGNNKSNNSKAFTQTERLNTLLRKYDKTDISCSAMEMKELEASVRALEPLVAGQQQQNSNYKKIDKLYAKAESLLSKMKRSATETIYGQKAGAKANSSAEEKAIDEPQQPEEGEDDDDKEPFWRNENTLLELQKHKQMELATSACIAGRKSATTTEGLRRGRPARRKDSPKQQRRSPRRPQNLNRRLGVENSDNDKIKALSSSPEKTNNLSRRFNSDPSLLAAGLAKKGFEQKQKNATFGVTDTEQPTRRHRSRSARRRLLDHPYVAEDKNAVAITTPTSTKEETISTMEDPKPVTSMRRSKSAGRRLDENAIRKSKNMEKSPGQGNGRRSRSSGRLPLLPADATENAKSRKDTRTPPRQSNTVTTFSSGGSSCDVEHLDGYITMGCSNSDSHPSPLSLNASSSSARRDSRRISNRKSPSTAGHSSPRRCTSATRAAMGLLLDDHSRLLDESSSRRGVRSSSTGSLWTLAQQCRDSKKEKGRTGRRMSLSPPKGNGTCLPSHSFLTGHAKPMPTMTTQRLPPNVFGSLSKKVPVFSTEKGRSVRPMSLSPPKGNGTRLPSHSLTGHVTPMPTMTTQRLPPNSLDSLSKKVPAVSSTIAAPPAAVPLKASAKPNGSNKLSSSPGSIPAQRPYRASSTSGLEVLSGRTSSRLLQQSQSSNKNATFEAMISSTKNNQIRNDQILRILQQLDSSASTASMQRSEMHSDMHHQMP